MISFSSDCSFGVLKNCKQFIIFETKVNKRIGCKMGEGDGLSFGGGEEKGKGEAVGRGKSISDQHADMLHYHYSFQKITLVNR